MSLPRFVGLKSEDNKYLRYVSIQEDIQMHGFLKFSGGEVVSPYAKFEVERAKSKHGLVHIKCCYNNKYWMVSRGTHKPGWIVAGANKPEEEQSKGSCTLFKPIYVDAKAAKVQFLHVRVGDNVCLTFDKDSCDDYTIIDWESLMVMPKYVAFKGDNGQYLSVLWTGLQFVSNDIGDPTVGHEIFTIHEGSIRVKSIYSGKFWRCGAINYWIYADSNDTTNNNSNTLFWPKKVGNNVIALCNLGNKNFCKRLATMCNINSRNAGVSTISKEAQMEVEELVISREIYNVNFRLSDSRIHSQNVLTIATQDAINVTPIPKNVKLKFSYKKTESSTWDASVSLKLGVKANFKAGVPFIVGGKIEILTEFSGAYKWGETKETSNIVETECKVIVPPMTTVRVSLLVK
ncbi:hypothetical protein QN277_009824 [Acacia crassicarpa]|uniref:Agglutinin domain-containing protein n=1 Tax=Acacia crassicarpa TaxID=499986 RepID=A0AAE1M682_9FABA|nr:hypothetical protein QN277_009824 [Acacia crassicarpa]